MNVDTKRILIFILLSLVVFEILISLQTTLWLQFFGGAPAPMLWLTFIIFIALNVELKFSFFLIYILSWIVASGSSVNPGVNVLIVLLILSTMNFLKIRIFWRGFSYYMLICTLAVPFYHFYHYLISYLEEKPITNPDIMGYLIETLMTPISAFILFPFFSFFLDSTLGKLQESRGLNL